jgi:hypothetical protein
MTAYLRRPLNADILAGALFLVLGAGAAWISLGYRVGTARSMGPGYVPLALGLLLCGFALALLIRGFAVAQSVREPFVWPPAVLVVGSLVAFGFLIERGGLAIALPVAVILGRLAGGDRNWLEIAVLSAGLLLFCYLVFVWALSVPVPVWPR